ncbi:MAG: hypothetical protein EOP04_17800 [Proteobacteria bacterium]|nr:MAG: hypothetical protein EOP04_17800 [Pseudomonadota bacterium]
MIVIKHGLEAIDRHRTGRSEHLLCEHCEGRISKWEKYAADWLYNRALVPAVESESESGTIYSGIDYEKFRLYCLSVLWRMAESSISFYEGVRLQASDAELIRKALMAEDPMDGSFPVCLFRIIGPNGELFPATVQPYQTVSARHTSFHLITNGFAHDFWVRGYEHLPYVKECSLKRDGRLAVPSILYSDYAPIQDVITHASTHWKKDEGPSSDSVKRP